MTSLEIKGTGSLYTSYNGETVEDLSWNMEYDGDSLNMETIQNGDITSIELDNEELKKLFDTSRSTDSLDDRLQRDLLQRDLLQRDLLQRDLLQRDLMHGDEEDMDLNPILIKTIDSIRHKKMQKQKHKKANKTTKKQKHKKANKTTKKQKHIKTSKKDKKDKKTKKGNKTTKIHKRK